MPLQIREELLALAGECSVKEASVANGWCVDCWVATADAVEALLAAYRRSIRPEIEAAIEARLRTRVNLEELFFQRNAPMTEEQKEQRNLVTRADMVEIAAAASAIAIEKVNVDAMILSNIPKMSRRRSEPGIDLLAVRLDDDAPADRWTDFERLYIGSAKHTTSRISTLRRDLEQSVSDVSLSIEYLAEQLKLLHNELTANGMDKERADRIYLILAHEPLLCPSHVSIIAVGAVDSTLSSAFAAQMTNLPDSPTDLRRLRQLLISDLISLHEKV